MEGITRVSRAWATVKRHILRSPEVPTSPKRVVLPIIPDLVAAYEEKTAAWLQVQEDGFKRYSSSIYSRDESSDSQSVLLPPSPTVATTISEYSMAPSRRHSRPYKVSSNEWVLVSEDSVSSGRASEVLSLEDLSDLQVSAHIKGVLRVFSKIYSLAKILHVAFLAYGVELDMGHTGLVYWIKRAETEVRTDSLSQLIVIVENLFYTVYSRVVLEMAAIELCAQFKMESRPLTNRHQFYLPDPDHMYRIFLAIKDVLDSPSMSEKLYEGVVHTYQESYIRRLLDKETDRGFNIEDMLGYRRFAMSIVNEKTGTFTQKWSALIPFFENIPAELMALISEKYFTVVPKIVLEGDMTALELPFIDIKTADFNLWEREIVKDHRQAALAKLEGKFVGELRREEGKSLLYLAKQHKCICAPVCRCSIECTNSPERLCPCSERQLRMMLAQNRKGPGRYNFASRANTTARVCFESLTFIQRNVRDGQLLQKLEEAIDLFEMEIMKERSPLSFGVEETSGHFAASTRSS